MSTARGIFVTGTDTGVGKTKVSCALARELCRRGIDVGVMKPIETGVGVAGPLDALALRAAAGVADAIETICPERFALAAAPSVAAAASGREVGLASIHAAFKILADRHELMLVEGAGGLLVPVAEGICMADLAGALGLPLLVVARAALGTINHTLLSLEAADARGLSVLGVILSHTSGALSDADEANLEALRNALDDSLIGELPPLGPKEQPARDAIDVPRLLTQLEQFGSCVPPNAALSLSKVLGGAS